MRKGNATINKMGKANIFDHAKTSSDKKIHPMERPDYLIQDILSTFTWQGAKILCPFLGSGNTIIAAHLQKMTCIGYDLSEEFKNSFSMRIIERFGV